MIIKTAKFLKGIVKADHSLEDGHPQIAFIGRSNVGKSSVINCLANQKGLAKTSSFPGRTQQINLFLINDLLYFVDLPGYGYAKTSKNIRTQIHKLINWYLFESGYKPKLVVLIIDAKVGPTEQDLEAIEMCTLAKKNFVIVANKIDKVKSSEKVKTFRKITEYIPDKQIIEFSSIKKIGISKLLKEIAK